MYSTHLAAYGFGCICCCVATELTFEFYTIRIYVGLDVLGVFDVVCHMYVCVVQLFQ